MNIRALLLPVILCVPVLAADSGSAPDGDAIVQNYSEAAREQAGTFHGASMEVEIRGALPKLKKSGRLHALRRISDLGRITYQVLGFEGDGTVKNQVIARYLSAEVDAQKNQAPGLAVTPENYKFHYRGRGMLDGRPVHIFEVTPRQKRVGLFRGHVWIDAATNLRLQEAGYLIKSPSVFLKKVAFLRRYEIRGGVPVPLHTESTVDTRLVGKAELTIDYSNYSAAAEVDEEELQ